MDMKTMDEIKAAFSFPGYELVDLSYTFEEGMPAWPTHPHYKREIIERYENGSYFNKISFCEHNGTHIDAPLHFIPGGTPLDGLDFTRFFGRALIVDAFTDYGVDHYLTAEHLRAWEEKHCAIQKGDMVFIRFGMDRKYALEPNDRAFVENWGGVDKGAAEYLVQKGVSIVGTDTLCIDAYNNADSDTHHAFLGSGIYVIENLMRLGELPPVVGIAALPLKFKDGSGSPIRVIAFVPRKD
ncbi:MAG: cyclase family protein [Oscillibacter sp.]|nr:cyclase family protein [Oscillibacter sp.]